MFKKKPDRMIHTWCVESITDVSIRLPKQIFPEVQWSDEEPRELVLKPIKEE